MGLLISSCSSDLPAAARACDIDRIRILLSNGEKVDGRDRDGYTALHRAAYAGCSETVVSELLQHGADPNALDPFSRTPMHLCFVYELSPSKVVADLLKGGADVNAKDYRGDTPLHYAAWRGDLEGANQLLAYGADDKLENSEGLNPGESCREIYVRDEASPNPSSQLKVMQIRRLAIIELLGK